MPKIKVTLSIGIANAIQTGFVDIPDEDWNDHETEEEKQKLMDSYWQDWANNYIDGGPSLVE